VTVSVRVSRTSSRKGFGERKLADFGEVAGDLQL
jgi:hypothetical protein